MEHLLLDPHLFSAGLKRVIHVTGARRLRQKPLLAEWTAMVVTGLVKPESPLRHIQAAIFCSSVEECTWKIGLSIREERQERRFPMCGKCDQVARATYQDCPHLADGTGCSHWSADWQSCCQDSDQEDIQGCAYARDPGQVWHYCDYDS